MECYHWALGKDEQKMTDKVLKKKVEFDEEVRDFTGLIFHCPNCDAEFHLHISEVKFIPTLIHAEKAMKGGK